MTSAKQVLDIARGQIGYNGTGSSDNPSSKFGKFYGIDPGHWCAMFVSWCFFQAGSPLHIETPKGFALVAAGRAFFVREHRLFGADTTPKPGDLVFFKFTTGNHIGIVESATSPSAIVSIQGNTNDAAQGRTGNCCRRKKHNNRFVTGFGRPMFDGAPRPQTGTYTVVSGDTLSKIAAAFLGNAGRYPEIMALNHLTSTVIQVGMKLKIPGLSRPAAAATATTYTVKAGDTLWDIARVKLGNGNRYPEIMHLNHLLSTQIYKGQVLKLPAR
jgi:nucleoid-associated protein YgaU